MTMQASEMTFGIEFECFLPAAVTVTNNITVGSYHRGIQVPNLPAGWTAESDSSLHTRKRGMIAMEIVSPILKGREGIEQIQTVVAKLKEWGWHTNASCGMHIHVGAALRNNVKALRNLVHLAAKFERGLFALTGTKRREHGCYSVPMSATYEAIKNLTNVDDCRRVCRKMQALNLTPLFSSKQTVEFRVFQGTTQITKILAYVQLVLGLVERAHSMTRTPKYNCENARYRSGQSMAYTMLRAINWFSEKRLGDKRFGMLQDDSELAKFKREFKRLAKKYDADETRQHPTIAAATPARRVNA